MNLVELSQLKTPFAPADLEWKVQRCGLKGSEPWAIVVPYVDARAIMKRLDEVAGPANWQSRITPTANGMLCELSLKLGGEWITKMDGSDETDYEPFKGGISKALVRAAVHWGVGRDLYTLPTVFARFVEKSTPGAHFVKIEGRDFWWLPNLRAESAAETAPAAPKAGAPKPEPAPRSAISGATVSQAALAVNQALPAVNPVERDHVNRTITAVNRMAAKSAVATLPDPREAAKGSAEIASEVIVPFGHNQGKRLADLTDAELAGLADFYARVPEPKGKARLFKREFDKYMSARSRAS